MRRRNTHSNSGRRLAFRGVQYLSALVLAHGISGTTFGQAQVQHQPHDVISTMALSPQFSEDGVMFAAIATPNHSAAIRSVDGGWTWNRMVAGMDNRGELTSCAVSPAFSEDGTAFLASDGDGVYRSTDSGDSWQHIGADLPSSRISLLACDVGSNGQIVVLAAGKTGGLYRSVDAGETWGQVLPAPIEITAIKFSTDFVHDGIVLAAGARGRLGVSRDSGAHWLLRSTPSYQPIGAIEVVRDHSDLLIILSVRGEGILISRDAGLTFSPSNQGLNALTIDDVKASPQFEQDQTLFCCAGTEAVYKSVDGGASWTYHDHGLHGTDQSEDSFRYILISNNYATDQTVFVGGYFGLAKSENGGDTWTELESRPPWIISGFDVQRRDSGAMFIIMSRYGAGLYASEDGGESWDVCNMGITDPYVYEVDASPTFAQDNTLIALQMENLLCSDDEGSWWSTLPIGPQIFPTKEQCSPQYSSDQTMFVGTRSDGIYRSRDGGLSYDCVNPTPGFVPSIVISPAFASDNTLFATIDGAGVIRSTDGGTTWESTNEGLGSLDYIQLTISSDFANDQTIYAAARDGLFVTSDAGVTWNKLDADPRIADANVRTLQLSPSFAQDSLILAASQGNGLLRSRDRGESWEWIAPQLLQDGYEARSIRFSPDFAHDSLVYLASDGDLFKSQDQGDTWTRIETNGLRYEDYNQSIAYTGRWNVNRNRAFSAGWMRFSTTPDASADFWFVGTSVTWVGLRGPQMGIAEVTLDGQSLGTVDLYSESIECVADLLSASDLSEGPHFVSIRVTGEKNPQSTGTTVGLDAFDITR